MCLLSLFATLCHFYILHHETDSKSHISFIHRIQQSTSLTNKFQDLVIFELLTLNLNQKILSLGFLAFDIQSSNFDLLWKPKPSFTQNILSNIGKKFKCEAETNTKREIRKSLQEDEHKQPVSSSFYIQIFYCNSL